MQMFVCWLLEAFGALRNGINQQRERETHHARSHHVSEEAMD
jgi:hypothetical protein